MLEVVSAPCPGLLLPQAGDLTQRMRSVNNSVNNWLAFSLSPHLTTDAPDLSGAPRPASNNDACFNALGALQRQDSSSMDTLAMPSDGSLCIMEAFSRSQQPKENWQIKSHALSRPMQTDSHCVQSQHYLGSDLSRLASSDQHLAQFELKQERDGPKLEDFLGGASLGGQYHSARTDSAHHDLDMYLAGASSAFDSRGDSSRINVNVPYSSMRAAEHHHLSYGAYHGLTASDVAMATMNSSHQHQGNGNNGGYDTTTGTTTSGSRHVVQNADQSALSLQGDNGNPAGALCTLQNALHHSQHHAQNLLHVAAMDHTGAVSVSAGDHSMLTDCSLQLPMPTSGQPTTMGPAGISAIKTWLRHHQVAASEKAGAGGASPLLQANLQSSKSGGGGGLNAISNLQSLSLSMSPGSQASSVLTAPLGASGTPSGSAPTSPRVAAEPRKRGAVRAAGKEPSPRKSIDTFGQRTSVYRGVTRHRWTGRYEAHLWDNSCRKEGQTRKGRQVYLGGYDKEEKAARAYDLAALKYWGPTTTINFPLSTYEKELEEMKNMTRQEYVASLRRKSSGFSRGASVYRGVTRHHQHGRWQARIGRVAGNKDLYLGTYSTQEEAAEAYDIAAIKFRGINAVTNFDISRYDTKRICSGAVTIGQLTSKVASLNKEAAAAAAAATEQLPPSSTPPALEQEHAQQQRAQEERQTMHSMENSSNQQTSVMKNLQQWQMLYQQQAQAHRNSWVEQQQQQQQQAEHEQQQQAAAAAAFSDSLSLQQHQQQHKYLQSAGLQHPSMHSQSAVLRNLMGLDALPTDGNDGSCSNGFLSTGSNPLMASTSGHAGAYSSATGDSPRNSAVSEGEEGTSKSAGYDNVLQGDLSRSISMYMSQSPTVKSNYDPSPLNSWTTNGSVQNLQVRPNMGGVGHGIPPIFAVWNE